jgi:hypothetical protein
VISFFFFSFLLTVHNGIKSIVRGCQNITPCPPFDVIYLTAIGLSPGGSSTVHIYTQTTHRTTKNKQYIEQHKNNWQCQGY